MNTPWGAPLTGAQMKLLRAAGLPNSTQVKNGRAGSVWRLDQLGLSNDEYYLGTSHPAYALLDAGWPDGRNVRLHDGSDKAPDDWGGERVLLKDGTFADPDFVQDIWWPEVIAYIAKAGGLTYTERLRADAERMAKRMGGELVKNDLWDDLDAASNHTASPLTTEQSAEIWRADARSAARLKELGTKDAEISRLREALTSIEALGSNLRQGGPDPMDLNDLSSALTEAVDIASNALTQE